MERKYKSPDEWFSQAEYDLTTARSMLRSRRYIYAIFFCHLTIEKALKGVFAFKLEKDPPKTHNLNYLCELIHLEIPGEFRDFLDNLNNLSVPTRYPDDLKKLLKDFKKDLTRESFKTTKELLAWLKEQII